ncbi:unnamed protein product, partial [Symbiodinium necroappetens]
MLGFRAMKESTKKSATAVLVWFETKRAKDMVPPDGDTVYSVSQQVHYSFITSTTPVTSRQLTRTRLLPPASRSRAGKAGQVQVQAPALVLDQQQQQQQQMLSFGHFLNSMYQKFQCNNQAALNLSFTQPGQGQPTGLPLQTGFGQQNNTAQLGQLSLQNGSQTHTAQPGVLALQNGLQNNTAQPAQLPLQNLQQLPPAATVAQGVAPASLELPAQNFPAQQPAESQPKQAEQQQEPAAGLEAFEDEHFRKLQEKKTQ